MSFSQIRPNYKIKLNFYQSFKVLQPAAVFKFVQSTAWFPNCILIRNLLFLLRLLLFFRRGIAFLRGLWYRNIYGNWYTSQNWWKLQNFTVIVPLCVASWVYGTLKCMPVSGQRSSDQHKIWWGHWPHLEEHISFFGEVSHFARRAATLILRSHAWGL